MNDKQERDPMKKIFITCLALLLTSDICMAQTATSYSDDSLSFTESVELMGKRYNFTAKNNTPPMCPDIKCMDNCEDLLAQCIRNVAHSAPGRITRMRNCGRERNLCLRRCGLIDCREIEKEDTGDLQ
jgi:hypothetical protein